MATIQSALIIDLDKSLITSDTLLDSASRCLSKNIFNIFKIFFWLIKGKSLLKYNLTKYYPIKGSELIYRTEILDFIKESKNKGKKVYLCSGSNKNQVKLVFEHLGLFVDYFGSSLNENLTGNNKKKFLEKKFGHKNFDYLGDSIVDIPIWRSCKKAYLVNVNSKVKSQLTKYNIGFNEIVKKDNFFQKLKNFFKVIRIYQWIKNLLIFLPIFLAQELLLSNFIQATIAFICFSFVSSFVYVMNDFLDIENDRKHPNKKNRPIASGNIDFLPLIFTIFIMLILSLFFAYITLNVLFLLILLFYILINFIYSSFIKKLFFLDVLTLSSFYTLRLVSGGFINDISLSPWLISFSIFFFLYLALIKRIGEVTNLLIIDKSIHGRSYNESMIKKTKYISFCSSLFSIILLLMYFSSEKVLTLYNNIYIMMSICPLLILWKFKIFKAAMNNKMHDDPIIYIAKDKFSWVIFIFITFVIISQMKIWY